MGKSIQAIRGGEKRRKTKTEGAFRKKKKGKNITIQTDGVETSSKEKRSEQWSIKRKKKGEIISPLQ